VGDGAASVVHNVPSLSVGDVLPSTTFFDQLGRGFSFTDFRGQTLLLAFVYTRCQDPRMCPLISAQFHQLQTKLAGLPIHLVEITLDPAYDTPDVLRRYGAQFGALPDRWTLGTGPVSVVQDFAARFGIAVFDDPARGLVHSERTAVVDRNGAIVDLIDAASWSPDDVAAELRSAASLPSNPIARLDYELSKAAAAICGNNVPGTAGLLSLVLAFAIFAGASWILFRIARKIFIEEP
jgi:cytochrome oxidase Cu insertion factor (SCO1/SenC/PrrC family)